MTDHPDQSSNTTVPCEILSADVFAAVNDGLIVLGRAADPAPHGS